MLCACLGQYGIGYAMGKSVKIQQLIHVDKPFTRAIEKILNRPGLDAGKVAVLVGGPDWPTSVTCGILKLNIPQMILGTCPVFFVSRRASPRALSWQGSQGARTRCGTCSRTPLLVPRSSSRWARASWRCTRSPTWCRAAGTSCQGGGQYVNVWVYLRHDGRIMFPTLQHKQQDRRPLRRGWTGGQRPELGASCRMAGPRAVR